MDTNLTTFHAKFGSVTTLIATCVTQSILATPTSNPDLIEEKTYKSNIIFGILTTVLTFVTLVVAIAAIEISRRCGSHRVHQCRDVENANGMAQVSVQRVDPFLDPPDSIKSSAPPSETMIVTKSSPTPTANRQMLPVKTSERSKIRKNDPSWGFGATIDVKAL